MKEHPSYQASFYRQALLIAAPVVILSAIAIYSLRMDRASILQDARNQAQALAPILADQVERRAAIVLGDFLKNWWLQEYAPVALAWPEGNWKYPGTASEYSLQDQQAQTDWHMADFPQIQGNILDGRIQIPVDYPALPAPPLWINLLTEEQARLNQAAEQALLRLRDPIAGAKAVAAMRSGSLPDAAIAGADFSLLLLQAGGNAAPTFTQRWIDLARKYPESCTAAGTPVADLALIRALRGFSRDRIPDSLRQELFHRVIRHPSFLTPEIIAAAEGLVDPQMARLAGMLKSIWLAQEKTRSALRMLLQQKLEPFQSSQIWVEADGELILAQCQPSIGSRDANNVRRPPGSYLYIKLIPGRVLERAFTNALAEIRSPLPAYLAAAVRIAGKRWPAAPASDQAGDSQQLMELASESKVVPVFPRLPEDLPTWISGGSDLAYLVPPTSNSLDVKFSLDLLLARPDELYLQYRRRLWLAVGLILAATAAAGIGIAGAWRAFRRQQQLAEMTTNFVSSVSHELRAPLASVRLMAESLDQDRITDHEKQKDYFRIIVQECRRLSSLVENVLEFSRIRQGRKQYEFEPINLAALVRQTVKLMEPISGEHQVDLFLSEPTPEDEKAQPCWDGHAVQQALVNLLDNAIKHSPAGAAVKVGYTSAKNTARTDIRIMVEDQGPGIPAEEQQKIFEPFYRLGRELRRETKGVGIGLSLVRSVAEAHGGRVFVESVMGQGSRFVLELPLEKPQKHPEAQR